MSVLIVDDNQDAADTLAELLRAAGHIANVAYDARAALACALLDRPGAILLDIGLPEMDGHELARHLRNHPATASSMLIAISGYGQECDRHGSYAAGIDHHLVKPVNPDDLLALLHGQAQSAEG